MYNLFKMGGVGFMGILTVEFTLILFLAIFLLITIIRKDYKEIQETRNRLKYIKNLGLFGLVTGILGQMIGLYFAFDAIAKAADISPAILFNGIKVSMIAPMYGMIIFLISYLLWMGIDYLASRKQ